MDRVLLLFDDLQYAGHIEKTLRKMGFDTETITNEYNLNDKIITFNPDFVIVKGSESSKASSLMVGKRLKDAIKFNGKVILMFSEDQRPQSEDLIKLRMDLLLIEPISAIRLAAHILSLSGGNHDAIMDRILRVAHTDLNFRHNEQQILKQMGESIDTEIQMISERLKAEDEEIVLDDRAIQSFIDPQYRNPVIPEKPTEPVIHSLMESEPEDHSAEFLIDPDYNTKIRQEIAKTEDELPFRIEAYNHAISAVDQDLKVGISKRQTKKRALELLEVTSTSEKKGRDEERKQFAKALWKK